VILIRDELEIEEKTTIHEIEDSKGLLANKKEVYFPEEIESQIRARFELFDRDGDGLLVLSELKVT
jgi:Ca2+-binding EF-hand superfamily protein